MELQDLSPKNRSSAHNQSLFGESHSTYAPERRVCEIDGCRVVGLSEDDEDFYRNFTKAQRRRVRVKTDLRLLPVLCILYLFAQLDRANIANAKIEGLKEDTGMTDKQYNLVLAIFFVPYFFLEVPSNMLLRRIARPSYYISFLVISWGLIMFCHAFVTNFAGMMTVRVLLGAFEAGFFPAAMYLCSQWYPRNQLAFRLSLFMAVASASGIFSGLMAAAIAQMGGIGGFSSWNWIFLIEGSVTILLGISTLFLLVDSPRRSGRWLLAHEIRYLEIMNRIKDSGSHSSDATFSNQFSDLKVIVMDWRYWAFGVLLHNVGACGYGLKFAVPSVIYGMGFTKSKSQLLSAVPYIFGVISALLVSFGSDRTSRRSHFVAGCFCCIIIGFCILLPVVSVAKHKMIGSIIGMSFVTSGVFPMAPINGSWISSNIGNSSRRAIGLAFIMCIGSLGGLTGSFMYDERDSPTFHRAFGLSIFLAAAGLLLVGALALSYWHSNRRRRNITEFEAREMYTEEQLVTMGDKSPLFRYTL